jgi:hypothetical protein
MHIVPLSSLLEIRFPVASSQGRLTSIRRSCALAPSQSCGTAGQKDETRTALAHRRMPTGPMDLVRTYERAERGGGERGVKSISDTLRLGSRLSACASVGAGSDMRTTTTAFGGTYGEPASFAQLQAICERSFGGFAEP